jgi:hypothetical protein
LPCQSTAFNSAQLYPLRQQLPQQAQLLPAPLPIAKQHDDHQDYSGRATLRSFLVLVFAAVSTVAYGQTGFVGGIGAGYDIGGIAGGGIGGGSISNKVGTVTPPTPVLANSGPSSGIVNVASTNFTVTLSSALFNGSQTATMLTEAKAGHSRPQSAHADRPALALSLRQTVPVASRSLIRQS